MKKCIVISDSFKGSLPSRDICAIARERIPLFLPACAVRALIDVHALAALVEHVGLG